MDEHDKKTELLVGLFLTFGFLLLGVLILEFSSVRELFRGSYTISVALPDGTGVKEGTPVELGGRKIGKVSDKPSFNSTFTGVIIPLSVYSSVKIPADAKFSLGTSGLLGDTFIDIKPSGKPSVSYIQAGTEVKGEPTGGLGALQNRAQEVGDKVTVALEDIRAAIKDLRETLKKLNEGALSDDSSKDLKETFKHLNSVVTRLDEKTLNDETSADIKAAVASLRSAAKAFEDGVKKLDPAFTKLDGVATKVEGIAGKADQVMDSADSALKGVERGAKSFTAAADDLRNGPGLFPALLRDPELKDEFKTLIQNLRQHGVLFYRDRSGRPAASAPAPAGRAAPASATAPAADDGRPRLSRPLTGTKR